MWRKWVHKLTERNWGKKRIDGHTWRRFKGLQGTIKGLTLTFERKAVGFIRRFSELVQLFNISGLPNWNNPWPDSSLVKKCQRTLLGFVRSREISDWTINVIIWALTLKFRMGFEPALYQCRYKDLLFGILGQKSDGNRTFRKARHINSESKYIHSLFSEALVGEKLKMIKILLWNWRNWNVYKVRKF